MSTLLDEPSATSTIHSAARLRRDDRRAGRVYLVRCPQDAHTRTEIAGRRHVGPDPVC